MSLELGEGRAGREAELRSRDKMSGESEYGYLAQEPVPSKKANRHILYRCLPVPAIIVPFRQTFWKLFPALVTSVSLGDSSVDTGKEHGAKKGSESFVPTSTARVHAIQSWMPPSEELEAACHLLAWTAFRAWLLTQRPGATRQLSLGPLSGHIQVLVGPLVFLPY